MEQRVPRRVWSGPRLAGRRPRLLIEDAHPALAISDFSLFHDAGFDVAFCSGPAGEPGACPLQRGRSCPAVAGADVVLHGLDPALGVAAAMRREYPHIPVVIELPRTGKTGDTDSTDTLPDGSVVLGYPCSVRGQIDALWRALDAASGQAADAQRALEPGRAVDAFAQQVGVPVMARVLLDHVDIHPAHAHLRVAVCMEERVVQ